MKYKGNNCEFNAERDAALSIAFRNEMSRCGQISIDDIAERAVKQECPRFYVSEERAKTVVSLLIKGVDVLSSMRPTKRRMFEEIYRRVVTLRCSRPKTPLCRLVCEVINSPAPEFYLSPRTARDRVFYNY